MRIPNVDDLKSKITAGKGYANPSLYYVQLPARNLNNEQKQSVELFVRNISLPSRNMLTVERNIGVDQTKVPYGYSNGAVSMTFRVLNDQLTRQYIEDWQSSMVSRYDDTVEGHVAVAYPKMYMRDIKISQLDRGISFSGINSNKSVGLGPVNINVGLDVDIRQSGREVYRWVLRDAYPISFTQEQLSDDRKGVTSEITVEFAYKYWTGDVVNGNRSSSIDTNVRVSTDAAQKAGKVVNDTFDKLGKKISDLLF